jgi:tetratricopeptide (TPR) repeat protein
MYLAKFFRFRDGRTDREVMLILTGRPMVLGIELDPARTEFVRTTHDDDRAAVEAFRTICRELAAGGGIETEDVDYTLGSIPPGSGPKADWKKTLDDLFLSWRAGNLEARWPDIEAVLAGPVRGEPFALMLAAYRHLLLPAPDYRQGLDFAEAALALWPDADADRRRRYVWSVRRPEITAMMQDAVGFAHMGFRQYAEALDAFERAYEASADSDRGGRIATILAYVFPEHREVAFDRAFRWGEFGGYDAVESLADYKAYVVARGSPDRPLDGWRWSSRTEPADPAVLDRLEADLGARLPPSYRRFLAERGRTELILRHEDHTAGLSFGRPETLAKAARDLAGFIARTDTEAARRHFREAYGVDLDRLLPAAEPWNLSSALVVHLGEGEAYGRTYLWDHDDAWVLEEARPDFDAAIASFTAALAARDKAAFRFLGIWLE